MRKYPTSYGRFSISNKILILLNQDISQQFSDLFNFSFSSSFFSSTPKTVRVSLFKKGSKLDCCNNRSISLLSNLEKIPEKLTYKRVCSFLTESENLYDLKFGFKQNLSTSHVLINLKENVNVTLDDEYIGCGIFVDLQKAFGTVVHEILLSKLDCCST